MGGSTNGAELPRPARTHSEKIKGLLMAKERNVHHPAQFAFQRPLNSVDPLTRAWAAP